MDTMREKELVSKSIPFVENLISILDYVLAASTPTISSGQMELVCSFQIFVDIGHILVMVNACL
jgi:hypothetical protein